mmetsp:Transcript_62168/g.172095  ORF Transcript_62168/g.172095 Transcript_62168/m.172095 type:complete len:242 (-) Transcript_62168:4-729(-)
MPGAAAARAATQCGPGDCDPDLQEPSGTAGPARHAPADARDRRRRGLAARGATADHPARAQAGPALCAKRRCRHRARCDRAQAGTRVSRDAQPRGGPQAAHQRALCQCAARDARRHQQLTARQPAAGGALVHQEHPAALRHHPARQYRDRRTPARLLHARRAGDEAAGAARDRRRARPARVHHLARDDGQVHGHALGHLRAEVLLRLGPEYRSRRRGLQHRGAGADQAVRRRRGLQEAAVR